MSDELISWSDDEQYPPAWVLPDRGDYLRIDLGDGTIHHAIVADSRENDDGSGGTIRVLGDPTNTGADVSDRPEPRDAGRWLAERIVPFQWMHASNAERERFLSAVTVPFCRHCGQVIHRDGDHWIHAGSMRVKCRDGRHDAEPEDD